MKNDTPDSLKDGLKNLISYSLMNGDRSRYVGFHQTILQYYFNGRNIRINYEANTIDLQIPVRNNHFTGITFECPDMCCFLQACLRLNESNTEFYKGLFYRYQENSAA